MSHLLRVLLLCVLPDESNNVVFGCLTSLTIEGLNPIRVIQTVRVTTHLYLLYELSVEGGVV